MDTTIPSVSVLGFSDTGKTTFIEALVRHATGDGMRVACFKYSRSPGQFDRPGSDTDIVRRAGAILTAFRGEAGWFVHAPPPPSERGDRPSGSPVGGTGSPAEIPEWILAADDAIDLVVSEGRIIADSIVVLAAGSAATTEVVKYDVHIADVVLGTPELARRVAGAVPVLPVEAAVSLVIDRIRKGGA